MYENTALVKHPSREEDLSTYICTDCQIKSSGTDKENKTEE